MHVVSIISAGQTTALVGIEREIVRLLVDELSGRGTRRVVGRVALS